MPLMWCRRWQEFTDVWNIKAGAGWTSWYRIGTRPLIRSRVRWIRDSRTRRNLVGAVVERAARAGTSESAAARAELPEPAEQTSCQDCTRQWKDCRRLGLGLDQVRPSQEQGRQVDVYSMPQNRLHLFTYKYSKSMCSNRLGDFSVLILLILSHQNKPVSTYIDAKQTVAVTVLYTVIMVSWN